MVYLHIIALVNELQYAYKMLKIYQTTLKNRKDL